MYRTSAGAGQSNSSRARSLARAHTLKEDSKPRVAVFVETPAPGSTASAARTAPPARFFSSPAGQRLSVMRSAATFSSKERPACAPGCCQTPPGPVSKFFGFSARPDPRSAHRHEREPPQLMEGERSRVPVFRVHYRIDRPGKKLAAVLLGPLAQRLEQRTHNPLVVGSNPTGPTKFLKGL
jgi:hypothetical protein